MKCETCEKTFNAMPGLEEYDQASGCAASLYLKDGQYFILAHYGSRYDMQRYALKINSGGNLYQVGNICDECITFYIVAGHAHLIEDGVW